MTQSGATTLEQSEPGSNANEGYSAFPKATALLESPHQTNLIRIQTQVYR